MYTVHIQKMYKNSDNSLAYIRMGIFKPKAMLQERIQECINKLSSQSK